MMEANERLINAVRNGPYIGSTETHGLPRIPRHDTYVKSRILIKSRQGGQRQNVPPSGHEYEYRRTPDSTRSGPRRLVHAVRPQLPADTRELEEARMVSNDSPAPVKIRNKLIERLDIARCPTPMPTDEEAEHVRLKYLDKPLDSSRSAWNNGLVTARTDMCTDGGGLTNRENIADFVEPRYPITSMANLGSQKKIKVTGSALKYDVIMSGSDRETEPETPTSASTLDLTENVIHYYFQRSVDKDKRIENWLVDCEEKSKSANQLPVLLPDILSSRRNITLIVEDV